jgi:hypothetical protein
MGKRSAIATTDEEAAKLTLPELNGQISLLRWRAERPDVSASLRRSALKRLVWLEERRDTLVCTENLSSGVVVVKSAKDGV